MIDDEIVSFGNIISSTFKNIKAEDFNRSLNLYEEWNNILCKIKPMYGNQNEGKNMASHSRIIDFKNGVLLIEADHPGWINLLQFHKKYILTGLKMKFPEIKFSTLAFRLKGSNAELSNENKSDEEIRVSIKKKFEIEDKLNRKAGIDIPDIKGKKDLPPELKAVFEDLKKNTLQ